MPPGFRLSATLRGVFLLALAGIVYVIAAHLAVAQKPGADGSPHKNSATKSETAKPVPKAAADTAPKAGPAATPVHHGLDGLPGPVLEMREAILDAVRSGRIEDLATAIELNEIKPAFGDAVEADPIAYLKKASADGEGHEVLAALGNILDAGYAVVPAGSDIENNRIYVWPYFAERGVKDLTPAQDVELLRLVPEARRKDMIAAGKYTHWSVGIGADGVWHFMRR
jgi:hypothetical protein